MERRVNAVLEGGIKAINLNMIYCYSYVIQLSHKSLKINVCLSCVR